MDIREEDIPDIGAQMASAEEAKREIERGISGARRVYQKYGDEIIEWAGNTGVDPFFALALMGVETSGRRHIIRGPRVSSAGAAGIGQFMPETWRSVTRELYGRSKDPEDRFDPDVAGPAVFFHIKQLHDMGINRPYEVAAAYNAGAHTVLRFREGKIKRLPTETRRYMTGVLTAMNVIEREILGEVVPRDEESLEEPESDIIERPESDDEILNKAMQGG
jgi:soluble lytic murein transglycosylase-like protein